ncbi:MAG: putative aminotransferase [Solirubrobacterales bacterium]|nr:putative aminotransferase [Solirubrobacterales bacterium]
MIDPRTPPPPRAPAHGEPYADMMPEAMATAGDRTPGWDSITDAFEAVYGRTPHEHRALPPNRQPPAPGAVLNGISAYRGEDHWHYVTFGLTELFTKRTGQPPGVSGWGHELTLLTPESDTAPDWGFELLMGVARTCVTHGRAFHAGARLAPGGSVDGASSGLVAIGLRADSLVQPTRFPLGRYELLQAVGVTLGEYKLMQRAGTLMVLERLAKRDPRLLTNPARA